MSFTIPPTSEAELDVLVAAFEDLTLPFEIWRKHRTHVTVTSTLAWTLDKSALTKRMSRGIRALNERNGVMRGYHHTVTLAWAAIIADHVRRAKDAGRTRLETVLSAIELCSDQTLLRRYYTPELLDSADARADWVEPDREALP